MTRFFGLFGKWWMVGVTDHAWHTALLPLAVPLHKCKRQNVHKLMFTQRCARKCKMLRGKMAQLGVFANNLFKACQLKRLKSVLVSQAAEWRTYFTEVLWPYDCLKTTWWLEFVKIPSHAILPNNILNFRSHHWVNINLCTFWHLRFAGALQGAAVQCVMHDLWLLPFTIYQTVQKSCHFQNRSTVILYISFFVLLPLRIDEGCPCFWTKFVLATQCTMVQCRQCKPGGKGT